MLVGALAVPASADHKRDRGDRHYSTYHDRDDRYELRSPRNYRHGYHRRYYKHYRGTRIYYSYPRYSRYYRDRHYSPAPWLVTGYLVNEALRGDRRYCPDRDRRRNRRHW